MNELLKFYFPLFKAATKIVNKSADLNHKLFSER